MRAERDRGSVLLSMPAAMLIVMLLGAIAVDLSIVQLRQREAVNAAASAANDAVTVGLDQDALRRGEGYQLDPARVERAVAESLDAQGLTDELAGPPLVTLPTADSVTVVIRLRAEELFVRTLPHHPDGTIVRGTATADIGRR